MHGENNHFKVKHMRLPSQLKIYSFQLMLYQILHGYKYQLVGEWIHQILHTESTITHTDIITLHAATLTTLWECASEVMSPLRSNVRSSSMWCWRYIIKGHAVWKPSKGHKCILTFDMYSCCSFAGTYTRHVTINCTLWVSKALVAELLLHTFGFKVTWWKIQVFLVHLRRFLDTVLLLDV